MNDQVRKQTREQKNECESNRTKEQTSERVNERTNERMNERISEQMDEQASEWASKQRNEWNKQTKKKKKGRRSAHMRRKPSYVWTSVQAQGTKKFRSLVLALTFLLRLCFFFVSHVWTGKCKTSLNRNKLFATGHIETFTVTVFITYNKFKH